MGTQILEKLLRKEFSQCKKLRKEVGVALKKLDKGKIGVSEAEKKYEAINKKMRDIREVFDDLKVELLFQMDLEQKRSFEKKISKAKKDAALKEKKNKQKNIRPQISDKNYQKSIF